MQVGAAKQPFFLINSDDKNHGIIGSTKPLSVVSTFTIYLTEEFMINMIMVWLYRLSFLYCLHVIACYWLCHAPKPWNCTVDTYRCVCEAVEQQYKVFNTFQQRLNNVSFLTEDQQDSKFLI